MIRYFLLFLFLFVPASVLLAQQRMSKEEAAGLALRNGSMLKAPNLSLQQQQQLLPGSGGLESPQLQYQLTPYDEGAQAGVQQTLSFPSVYRSRKLLQSERIRLAQLQLSVAAYDLKNAVRISYLQLQYLAEKTRLLAFQDSIYSAIKTSSKRFFEAGQINKLEELQASTQADAIRNEWRRSEAEREAELQLFRFYTGYQETFLTTEIEPYLFVSSSDTLLTNIQQQILQQQIAINQGEMQVAKKSLLPELQAAVLFPTISQHERPVGYQLGLTIPVWQRQNKSRIAAASTGTAVAKAQAELEQLRLLAQYRQTFANFNKEVQSLAYYTTTALPQAQAIIETSQRLFQGGELNYIESLRNLATAFTIRNDYLEMLRTYNETVIQLSYLNGTL